MTDPLDDLFVFFGIIIFFIAGFAGGFAVTAFLAKVFL